MRFACQSCGKAYNLPEERIADKSNVKLKCRVCGAIVEVKRQGELVATVLDDAEAKRMLRVSEAPTPLTSIGPEDDDPDGATVSISEASINEHASFELELSSLPPAAATGFSPGALSLGALSASSLPPPLMRGEAGLGRLDAVNVAPPLPPPPLSPSSLPPPPTHQMDASGEAAANGGSITGGATVTGGAINGGAVVGSNGSGVHFPDEVDSESEDADEDEDEDDEESSAAEGLAQHTGAQLVPPVAPGATASNALNAELLGPSVDGLSEARPQRDPMMKFKLLAAVLTGVVIDRIISGLFP